MGLAVGIWYAALNRWGMRRTWRAPKSRLNVVITGATKGLGKAMAREFLRQADALAWPACRLWWNIELTCWDYLLSLQALQKMVACSRQLVRPQESMACCISAFIQSQSVEGLHTCQLRLRCHH